MLPEERAQALKLMKRRVGAGLILLVLTLVAAFTSLSLMEGRSQESSFVALKGFLQAATHINQSYVEEPDNQLLFVSALNGMARVLASSEIEFATEELIANAGPIRNVRDLVSQFELSLRKARSLIHDAQVQDASIEEIIRGGLSGMVSGLARASTDSYTYYLPPKEAKDLTDSLHNQHFGGVGIYIEYLPEVQKILVLSVLPETPAFKSGLETGDLIIKVDGKTLQEIPIDSPEAAREIIRGEIGSQVNLTIERDGVPAPVDYLITRDKIDVKSTFKVDLDDEIAYVRIDNFTGEAGEEVKKYLEYFNSAGSKGLVLDLRSNPGGLLEAAVHVSALFLPPSTMITYTQGRKTVQGEPRFQQEYRVRNREQIWDKPLVVMVNQHSASASEIVTGALKDHGRGIVVGLRTFGKGSVQEIFPLPDESSLRLTVAYYFTPSGVCIHQVGIEPDFEVKYERPESEEKPNGTGGNIDRRSYLQRQREALLKDNQVQESMRILREIFAGGDFSLTDHKTDAGQHAETGGLTGL